MGKYDSLEFALHQAEREALGDFKFFESGERYGATGRISQRPPSLETIYLPKPRIRDQISSRLKVPACVGWIAG